MKRGDHRPKKGKDGLQGMAEGPPVRQGALRVERHRRGGVEGKKAWLPWLHGWPA